MRAVLLVVAAVVLSGCRKDESSSPAPAASSSSPVAAPVASPSSTARPVASVDPAARVPLQLQKFRFASGLRGKEPQDELTSAEPGQRVWAHFTFRNRTGDTRKVHVVFRVAGDKRTEVDLSVDVSWSFRTWAYNTLRDGDTGDLSVVATDDLGNVLVDEKIPIKKPKSGKK